MHVRDGIAPMEQASASLKVLLPGTQALQIWFDGSQHDNYHVSNAWGVARGSYGQSLFERRMKLAAAFSNLREHICAFW
jgi:hypothetical protein